jgi:hypothetical protein
MKSPKKPSGLDAALARRGLTMPRAAFANRQKGVKQPGTKAVRLYVQAQRELREECE